MPKNKAKAKNKDFEKMAKEKIHEGARELKKMLADAKAKFDNTDEATKKKIVAGVAGAVALIAGAISLNRLRKGKK